MCLEFFLIDNIYYVHVYQWRCYFVLQELLTSEVSYFNGLNLLSGVGTYLKPSSNYKELNVLFDAVGGLDGKIFCSGQELQTEQSKVHAP